MEVEGAEIQAPSDHAEPKNNKDDQDSAKGSSRKKRKQREFAFPAVDRPARERKSIERLIVSPDKEVKEFKIQKGSGTALKDIPNIVFKLSKRRTGDEVVQALHKVLFVRSSHKHAKGSILQFSGFVWRGDEEKEKAKVKDRLERCVKENLFQISDLLDLPLSKSSKKEDAVLKIFEFLESPYKTTDQLVEGSGKSKRGRKAKKTPVKRSKTKALGKSPKKDRKGAKKTSRKKQSSDEEDESDAAEFDEDIDEEQEDKGDVDYGKESSSAKKRKRKSPKKETVQESEDEEPLPKKKKPRKEIKERKKEPIREAKKEKKPKKKAPKVEEPSDEDLREAICELLQNADFSKVTFTDVMKQLGEKFNADLTHRKAQLKAMIQEEIHKLVGEGDNEDEGGDNEGEIDDNGDKANGDEQEEHEDASGDVKAEDEDHEDASGKVKADVEEEDGDGNAAEGDGDEEEDGEDAKPDGGNEDEDQNSTEDNKPDNEDEGEDVKEEKDHEARAEEDTTEMA